MALRGSLLALGLFLHLCVPDSFAGGLGFGVKFLAVLAAVRPSRPGGGASRLALGLGASIAAFWTMAVLAHGPSAPDLQALARQLANLAFGLLLALLLHDRPVARSRVVAAAILLAIGMGLLQLALDRFLIPVDYPFQGRFSLPGIEDPNLLAFFLVLLLAAYHRAHLSHDAGPLTVLTAMALVLGIVLTFSRTAYLMLLFYGVLAFYFGAVYLNVRRVGQAATAGLLLIPAGFLVLDRQYLRDYVQRRFSGDVDTVNEREVLWTAGWDRLRSQFSFSGVGPASDSLVVARPNGVSYTFHNQVLSKGLEYGIAGLLSVAAALLVLVARLPAIAARPDGWHYAALLPMYGLAIMTTSYEFGAFLFYLAAYPSGGDLA